MANKAMSPILSCIFEFPDSNQIQNKFFELIWKLPGGERHLNVKFIQISSVTFIPSILKAVHDFYLGVELSVLNRAVGKWTKDDLKQFL